MVAVIGANGQPIRTHRSRARLRRSHRV